MARVVFAHSISLARSRRLARSVDSRERAAAVDGQVARLHRAHPVEQGGRVGTHAVTSVVARATALRASARPCERAAAYVPEVLGSIVGSMLRP